MFFNRVYKRSARHNNHFFGINENDNNMNTNNSNRVTRSQSYKYEMDQKRKKFKIIRSNYNFMRFGVGGGISGPMWYMLQPNPSISRPKMAIRKHEVVQNPCQWDLNVLVDFIQHLNEQPDYMLSPAELISNCLDIVACLAHQPPHSVQWLKLQIIEDFLLRVVNSVDADVRHEIITAIVQKLNNYTSDTECELGPATSVVLVVMSTDIDASRAAARWLLQQTELAGGMRATLKCLYTWLFQWDGTPSLGDWVMSIIKAMEENERFDVLIEVSIEHLGNLISTLDDPGNLRPSNADVVLHILASLRESKGALDAVAPHVGRVLNDLASDSGQFSRQLLQDVVDILSCMVNSRGPRTKIRYVEVVLCLEEHMASRSCEYLQLIPWRTRTNISKPASSRRQAVKKVGLTNLGNTCYMNSVMQALLLTRQFSSHVMMRMINKPYWSRMSILFAKMMHSICTRLNPDEFFKVVKPPFFTLNNQHDSSEFLGYLFELLQNFEHLSDVNFDYTKPAVLAPAARWRPPLPSCNAEYSEAGSNRRSVSPRPSGSGSGCSSSSSKRGPSDGDNHPFRKRMRITDNSYLRRNSVIDQIFGGILLTRVECMECHSASLQRDVFRDLQLGFPDKPEGWQHSVQSLLDFYCTKEMLTGDNQYHCRDCEGLRDAERSVLIETTPRYLILVLKNFKFNPKVHVQTKLMHKTFHNPTVTLPSVRSQTVHSTYSLYAAVIHSGTTLDSGHYYTLAKDSGSWYEYNDDTVDATDDQQIHHLSQSCTPYLLFYKRNDIQEGPDPAIDNLPRMLQESVMSHDKPYVDGAMDPHISRK